MAVTSTTISVDFLTELLLIRQEYLKVCKTFSIPPELASKEGTGDKINERINQYVTSYLMRKSLSERENGQAFREETTEPLPDPLESNNGKT